MNSLLPGTIIDFDMFSAIVVGDNLLLVFESEVTYFAREGQLLRLECRGTNHWSLRVYDDDQWEKADYLISRDWNGKMHCRSYDEFEWHSFWDDDDYDWEFEARQDEYDTIYDDNNW